MKIFCLNVQVSGVYEDLFMLMGVCVWVCVCVCVCVCSWNWVLFCRDCGVLCVHTAQCNV